MQRDLLIAGMLSLLTGTGVFASASALSTLLPILLSPPLLVAITFAFLLALSVIEIPLMLFGLRQMARTTSTPHRLLVGTFALYVMFASIYASIFVLLTGEIGGGLALAVLCLIRYVSGMWVR